VVVVPFGGEGGEQNDPGVIDQDVSSAEFGLDAAGGGHEGVAVGDVGLNSDSAIAELTG